MKVTYLDLRTGRTAQNTGITVFELTENSWSCDCNRRIPFGDDASLNCRCQRYVVISVEAESADGPIDAECVIREANLEYCLSLAGRPRSQPTPTPAPSPDCCDAGTDQ